MSNPSELKELLEKMPLWEKLQSIPAEMEALRKRVEALEAPTNQKPAQASGDKCPRCQQFTYRLDKTIDDPEFGALGVQRDIYLCSACNYSKYNVIG